MQPPFRVEFAASPSKLFEIFGFNTIDRFYPTFCVLQALLHYILCFMKKKIQHLVGKLLKNMWIKPTDALIIGGMNKY